MTKRILVSLLPCVCLTAAAFAAGPPASNPNAPTVTITKVTAAGLDAPPAMLTIGGQNFGTAPQVTIGSSGGTLVPLTGGTVSGGRSFVPEDPTLS